MFISSVCMMMIGGMKVCIECIKTKFVISKVWHFQSLAFYIHMDLLIFNDLLRRDQSFEVDY